MINKGSFNKFKDQSNIILKSRFLKNLTSLQRYEFLQLCHRRKYKEGEYIYYQNDPGTGVYFIEKGRVQLIVQNNNDNTETGMLTFDMEPPESFGVMSIGYELRRMSSAKCLTDCTLLGFFNPDFETLKKRHPEIAVKFLETVSMLTIRQLKRATYKLEEVTDTKTAFSIQFQTYYEDEKKEQV